MSLETGVYLPGLFAGFGMAFAVAFIFAVFYVAWSVFVELVSP